MLSSTSIIGARAKLNYSVGKEDLVSSHPGAGRGAKLLRLCHCWSDKPHGRGGMLCGTLTVGRACLINHGMAQCASNGRHRKLFLGRCPSLEDFLINCIFGEHNLNHTLPANAERVAAARVPWWWAPWKRLFSQRKSGSTEERWLWRWQSQLNTTL